VLVNIQTVPEEHPIAIFAVLENIQRLRVEQVTVIKAVP